MAATGVHENNFSTENNDVDSTSSRVHAKSFDFQAAGAARKSLQTLQFSSANHKELVSKDGPIKPRLSKGSKGHKKKVMIKPSNKPIEVYRDPMPSPIRAEPVSAEEEALQLMGGESTPESYWRLIAEERRVALDDSLHENEMLHKEVENLKEENSRLTEMAGQAEYLASILQTAVESSSDEEDAGVTPDSVPKDNSVRNEEVESYESSYEVISLTDEPAPTLSDEDETGDKKSPEFDNSEKDADSHTECSATQNEQQQVDNSHNSESPDAQSGVSDSKSTESPDPAPENDSKNA